MFYYYYYYHYHHHQGIAARADLIGPDLVVVHRP